MKIAIIDDDKEYQDKIEALLTDYRDITQLDPSDLKERSYQDYDLYFLDIEMSPNGLDIAKRIGEFNKGAIIIFITNYDHYIFDTQILNPFYFIRKNHLAHDLKICLSLLKDALNDYIEVSFNNDKYLVNLKDIHYIEIYKGKITLYTINRVIDYWGTLKNLKSQLPDNQFYQVHRSYIVNKDYITQIEGHSLIIDGKAIPIARNHYKKISQLLKEKLR